MSADELNIDEGSLDLAIAEEQEPSAFTLISSLGIAGFFSGLILVSVYLFSTPYIEANKAEALKKAIFMVLPNCESFETLELKEGKLTIVKEAGTKSKKAKSEKKARQIFAGFDADKQLIGFAIPGSEPGFQDIIGAIIGYDHSQKVIIGFEVLESKETPGLGDKIFKDANFKLNFKALSILPEIKAVKPGKRTNPNDVETITGATISSKAVVRLLNNTMQELESPIDVYMKEQSNGSR
jgi:electron transport complex protein RnfG